MRADTLVAVFGDLDIVGKPGTAQPPGALIRAYPLDTSDPPIEATVKPDGSFELLGVASTGEEVRLQLVTEDSRSEPLDVVVGEKGSPCVAALRPLASCLELDPAKEIELASRPTLTVRNGCTTSVTLTAPRPRRELAELGLGTNIAWPATLPSGETLTINVQLTSTASFDEEIFFVETTAPERDRRPITLRPSP